MQKLPGRRTKAKEAVWELLKNTSHALTHAEIEESIQVKVDRVTLYRILNFFEEEAIIHKIVGPDGRTYFALCQHTCESDGHVDGHIHFSCDQCGKLTCLTEEPTIHIRGDFTVRKATFLIEGICTGCKQG